MAYKIQNLINRNRQEPVEAGLLPSRPEVVSAPVGPLSVSRREGPEILSALMYPMRYS
jgi:hypothetical protein